VPEGYDRQTENFLRVVVRLLLLIFIAFEALHAALYKYKYNNNNWYKCSESVCCWDRKIKVWDLAAALDPRSPTSTLCLRTLVVSSDLYQDLVPEFITRFQIWVDATRFCTDSGETDENLALQALWQNSVL